LLDFQAFPSDSLACLLSGNRRRKACAVSSWIRSKAGGLGAGAGEGAAGVGGADAEADAEAPEGGAVAVAEEAPQVLCVPAPPPERKATAKKLALRSLRDLSSKLQPFVPRLCKGVRELVQNGLDGAEAPVALSDPAAPGNPFENQGPENAPGAEDVEMEDAEQPAAAVPDPAPGAIVPVAAPAERMMCL